MPSSDCHWPQNSCLRTCGWTKAICGEPITSPTCQSVDAKICWSVSLPKRFQETLARSSKRTLQYARNDRVHFFHFKQQSNISSNKLWGRNRKKTLKEAIKCRFCGPCSLFVLLAFLFCVSQVEGMAKFHLANALTFQARFKQNITASNK